MSGPLILFWHQYVPAALHQCSTLPYTIETGYIELKGHFEIVERIDNVKCGICLSEAYRETKHVSDSSEIYLKAIIGQFVSWKPWQSHKSQLIVHILATPSFGMHVQDEKMFLKLHLSDNERTRVSVHIAVLFALSTLHHITFICSGKA